MTRGLLLDLDGTLADSLGMLQQVYRDFLSAHGSAGTEEEFERLNGPPLPEIVAYLRREHALAPSESELLRAYLTLIRERSHQIAPAPGALALLQRAREKKWKTAVVTSSTHRHTEHWLEQNNLRPWIDLIVGGDNVTRGKPDPTPYRHAIEQLGVDAAHSIAVEDSVQGATAATGAGLPTRVIVRSAPDRDAWPAGVTFIRHFDDVTL